jgi:hypothetical protein
MKYNILKDEIYRTSYLICESLFLEEDWEEKEGKRRNRGEEEKRRRV